MKTNKDGAINIDKTTIEWYNSFDLTRGTLLSPHALICAGCMIHIYRQGIV